MLCILAAATVLAPCMLCMRCSAWAVGTTAQLRGIAAPPHKLTRLPTLARPHHPQAQSRRKWSALGDPMPATIQRFSGFHAGHHLCNSCQPPPRQTGGDVEPRFRQLRLQGLNVSHTRGHVCCGFATPPALAQAWHACRPATAAALRRPCVGCIPSSFTLAHLLFPREKGKRSTIGSHHLWLLPPALLQHLHPAPKAAPSMHSMHWQCIILRCRAVSVPSKLTFLTAVQQRACCAADASLWPPGIPLCHPACDARAHPAAADLSRTRSVSSLPFPSAA